MMLLFTLLGLLKLRIVRPRAAEENFEQCVTRLKSKGKEAASE